jgi:hypothetical protein
MSAIAGLPGEDSFRVLPLSMRWLNGEPLLAGITQGHRHALVVFFNLKQIFD